MTVSPFAPPPADDISPLVEDPMTPPPGSGAVKMAVLLVLVAAAVFGGWKLLPAARASGPWLGSYEQGIAASRATGRPMLVYYTADWCGYCQKMKREVFQRPDIADWMASDLVLVMMDMSRRSAANAALARHYEIEGYPTLIFYNRDLEEVDRLVGGVNAETFTGWLHGCAR